MTNIGWIILAVMVIFILAYLIGKWRKSVKEEKEFQEARDISVDRFENTRPAVNVGEWVSPTNPQSNPPAEPYPMEQELETVGEEAVSAQEDVIEEAADVIEDITENPIVDAVMNEAEAVSSAPVIEKIAAFASVDYPGQKAGLTKKDLKAIYSKYNRGDSVNSISILYDISRDTVKRIIEYVSENPDHFGKKKKSV